MGQIARQFWCNYIDKTSWFKENNLNLLGAMVNERVAFPHIDSHRSKSVFEELSQDLNGISISDDCGLYQKWTNRQTCIAHLIRKADALSERKKRDLRYFGEIVSAMLKRLVSFAKVLKILFPQFSPGLRLGLIYRLPREYLPRFCVRTRG